MVRVALPIGVSEYRRLARLPSAVPNAVALGQVLCCPERGGFIQPELSALQNLTRQAMETLVADWSARLKPDDLLLLYFSGYGLSDGQGQLYLATQDTDLEDDQLLPASAVAASTLQGILNRCPATQQIVMLDCCRPEGMPDAIAPPTLPSLQQYLGGQGRLLFAAFPRSSQSVNPQENNLLTFTRYLVDGLSSGVADLDGDGWVTLAELQDYTRRQVRRAAPTMEMVYTQHIEPPIRLVRSPVDSPELTYRKRVDDWLDDVGDTEEISFVGRQELDRLRSQLELSTQVTEAIEAAARSPHEEYRHRLRHYEQAMREELMVQQPLESEQCDRLQQIRQALELREADVTALATRVLEQADQVQQQQSRQTEQQQVQQRLQLYQQEFRQAARWEHPLRQDVRRRLDQLAAKLELSPEAIAPIEQAVLAQVGVDSPAYQQKMQQYDRDFRKMVQRQYPLSAEMFDALQQFWQHLELRSQDVERIEQQAIATLMQQHQDSHSNLNRYKAIAQQTLSLKFPLNPVAQRELMRVQQALQLQTAEVEPIQQEIIQSLKRQQAIAQETLERYRQEFSRAMQLEFPIPEATQAELKQFQQDLGIHTRDADLIERQLIAQAEAATLDETQRLERYVQEFSDAVGQRFPLSRTLRQGFNELKQNLELNEAEVSALEQAILRHAHEQEQQYHRQLDLYAHEFAEQVRRQSSFDEATRRELGQFQESLGLMEPDVQQIEALILARYQLSSPSHQETSPEAIASPPLDDSTPPAATLETSPPRELPEVNTPEVNTPEVKALEAETSEVQVPEVKTPEAGTLEAETPEVGTPEAELPAEDRLEASANERHPFDTQDCEPCESEAEAAADASQETLIERVVIDPSSFKAPPPERAIVRSRHVPLNRANSNGGQPNRATETDEVMPTTRLTNRAAKGTEAEPLPSFPTTDPFADLPDRYVRLALLLEQQDWQEADRETFNIMLEMTEPRQVRRLDQDAIASLFCADLRLIDQLWRHHSNNRFGFSVQHQIYENLRPKTAIDFGKQVGWWMKGLEFFKYYSWLNFSRNAPRGHFPAYWFWQISHWDSIRTGGTGTGRGGCGNDRWMLHALMAKLADCHIL